MVAQISPGVHLHPSRLLSRALLFTLIMGTAAAPHAADPPLFLVDSTFDLPETTSVYEVVPTNGVVTLRANLGAAYTPVLAMAAADATVLYMTGTDPARGCPFSCILLRVELDSVSTVPRSVVDLGPVRHNGIVVSGLAGMTFRKDGDLYAASQDTESLYRIDVATAVATLVGSAGIDLHGGDITFDAADRLWLWTNIGPNAGLYEMNPSTGAATLADRRQNVNLAGLAALGHANVMYGAAPPEDRLYEILPVTGMTGVSSLMTLGGVRFDHKRGDLDSPFCASNADCDDFDPCTTDRCTAGGCRSLLEDATCDGVDDDCDGFVDEDYVPAPTACGVGACAGNIGALACVNGSVSNTCDPFNGSAANDATCNGVDDDCDGLLDEDYVPVSTACSPGSCAASAATSCVAGQVVDACRPSPFINVNRTSPSIVEIGWVPISGVVGYNIVKGTLSLLRTSGGSFSLAVTQCLGNDVAGSATQDADPLPVGGGVWYLVRGASCPGAGSYDTGAPSQIRSRDLGIGSSPATCP